MVLGSVLIEDERFLDVGSRLRPEDFSVERHRRIFARMLSLNARGERIDRVTVANELLRENQLEAVGGLEYVVSLDDGLPRVVNLDSYVRIVRENSLLRQMIMVSQATINRCTLATEPAVDILAGAERDLLGLSDSGRKADPATPGEILDQFEGGANAFLDPSKRPKGIGTGFRRLDEMTGGLHKGDLFILAARPSMGKTALAMNIADHVAVDLDLPVVVFSLEMSREALLTRLICARAGIDQQRFRSGYLNQDERMALSAATSRITRSPVWIDDAGDAGLMDIHSKLRRIKARDGLALAVVDYLQLMSTPRGRENRTEKVGELSRGLKLLAKELDVPMLVLSQLSRAPETRPGDHRPQMSDLRESGSIEQDADAVAFIFREEVYKPDRDDLRGRAELLLRKQRNGPVGTVHLTFLRHLTKFTDAETRGEEWQREE